MIWFINFYLEVLDSMIYQRTLYSLQFKGTRFPSFRTLPKIELPTYQNLVKLRVRAKLLQQQLKRIQVIALCIQSNARQRTSDENIRAGRQDILNSIRDVKFNAEERALIDRNTERLYKSTEARVDGPDFLTILKEELARPFLHNLKFTSDDRVLFNKIENYSSLVYAGEPILLSWARDKHIYFGEDDHHCKVTQEDLQDFVVASFNSDYNLRLIRSAGTCGSIDIDRLLRYLDPATYDRAEDVSSHLLSERP